MRTAIFSGSFDPLTLGHMDIILRASSLVDKLVIGVGQHATKSALLSPNERCALIESAIAHQKTQGAEIVVHPFSGLIVDFARSMKATIIVRSLRYGSDYDYEAGMAAMNRKLTAGGVALETIFLPAAPEHAFLSSTLVRQVFEMGGNVAHFIPEGALSAIEAKRKK